MKDDSSTHKLSLNDLLYASGKAFLRYAAVLFCLLLIGIYGFVGYQIVVAQGALPSDADVSAKVQETPVPHVNPDTVSQLQSLQDNSVSVKALFDEARSNPFHE